MSAATRERDESPLRPYEALHEHVELELELAGRGELARLQELGARWEQLVAELPASPPPAAAELIENARLMHARTRIELERLRDALLAELATAKRSRRAADGYGSQLQHRQHLSRSA